MDFVAEFLLMYETMDGDQFAAAMDQNASVKELEAIAESKKERSRHENEEQARREEERRAEELRKSLPIPEESGVVEEAAAPEAEERVEEAKPSENDSENNE